MRGRWLLGAWVLVLAGCDAPPQTLFDGPWQNANSDARTIQRLDFRTNGDQLVLQVWSACTPDPCYWGENDAPVAEARDAQVSYHWQETFRTEDQTYRVVEGEAIPLDSLYLDAFTTFTDGSGRPPQGYSERFIRS